MTPDAPTLGPMPQSGAVRVPGGQGAILASNPPAQKERE